MRMNKLEVASFFANEMNVSQSTRDKIFPNFQYILYNRGCINLILQLMYNFKLQFLIHLLEGDENFYDYDFRIVISLTWILASLHAFSFDF